MPYAKEILPKLHRNSKMIMKHFAPLIVSLLLSCILVAQDTTSIYMQENTTSAYTPKDSTAAYTPKAHRYGVWLVPTLSRNIYGLAIGPFGSEAICNWPYTKYSHGINLQIFGQGFFQTWYINNGHVKENYSPENQHKLLALYDTTYNKATHNGILLSPLGTFTDEVNGISISGWMSMGRTVNGISLNALWNLYARINGLSIGAVNHAIKMNGIQIGLFNTANELKGLQIGLWNKSGRRGLPVVNWGG